MEVHVCVKHPFLITHYYHSGFSIAGEHTLLVFDYWRGERGELTPELQLTPEKLRAYDKVFVFISHEHIDHLDPVVFTWNEAGNVSWIVSSDMPVGTRGKRMAPGDTVRLSDEVTVTAFDSTDLGVSFLVDFLGLRFFHAGDLNFWHWREESTKQEIEEADEEFRKAVQPISREKIDVAFFPVDPRQGAMFEAGANYFILAVKPRILIPMHYFHRADTATDYARTASCRTTEVLAMKRKPSEPPGKSMAPDRRSRSWRRTIPSWRATCRCPPWQPKNRSRRRADLSTVTTVFHTLSTVFHQYSQK